VQVSPDNIFARVTLARWGARFSLTAHGMTKALWVASDMLSFGGR
jgi:hypothetical protein